MADWNEQKLIELLKEIDYPGMTRNIVEYGVVQGVAVKDGQAAVDMEVLTRDETVPQQLREQVEAKLKGAGLEPVLNLEVKKFPSVGGGGGGAPSGAPGGAPAGPHGTSPDPWADRRKDDQIRFVLAVASGKGGVGKSTVAVNLALALKYQGLNVGLMDADIYGPSQPMMLGIEEPELLSDEQRRIYPVEAHGLKAISIGFLIHDDQPVIWRGPLVMKTIEQFLRGVVWGALDVLVVDLPPGTGDAQLSLVQKTPIDGVVMVTTPQDVALADVVRGHAMFDKVDVPTLGVIENMSYFVAPDTGKRYDIFGHGGGKTTAEQRGLEFFGEIPIEPAIRQSADEGEPIVVRAPSSESSQAFHTIAGKVLRALEAQTGQKV